MFNCIRGRVAQVLLVLLSLNVLLIIADCECGYSVNSTASQSHTVFTDLLETNWIHIQNVTLDTDWQPQKFNVTAAVSHGTYGTSSELGNVISNPMNDSYSSVGPSRLGGDAGLQLWVRSKLAWGQVPTAEIDSKRTDMLYGSFRASMKHTSIPGTCAAFFFYYDDVQEVDFEFLSSQFNESSSPVNLVLHSSFTLQHGDDPNRSPTFKVIQLPFHPDKGFHEYRFDWMPGKVSFYADGKWLADMIEAVPTQPGHIALSHWSNGNSLWSGGPPASDAVMTVQYVKAYFNSSLPQRHLDYSKRCRDPHAQNAICVIPDQTIAPDISGPNGNVTASTFFFSAGKNQTNNQTVYTDKKGAASGHEPISWSTVIVSVVIGVAVAFLL